jgi:site-specific DNA-cytosine methylase
MLQRSLGDRHEIVGTSSRHGCRLLHSERPHVQRAGRSRTVPSRAVDECRCNLPRSASSQVKRPIALSFFSGALGLDLGLERAGISPVLASEINPATRETIAANRPNLALIGDVRDYQTSEIRKAAGLGDADIDLVVGGPPCQAFSTAGKRAGFKDARGNLLLTFVDLILELRPRYAVIENVRGLLSATMPQRSKEGKGGALRHVISLLEKGGYAHPRRRLCTRQR